ncbi:MULTISPECIES: hypothetical protein [Streptomyces]|uniref:hypothetical protein n=1 Tax=Streptomyces TaxID=1883 RepID=UPI00352DC578
MLPQAATPGRLFTISPATFDLYTVGVHWALGNIGAALDAGRNVRPKQFPTAERMARLGTDMARARWAWQRPEQTARALLDAYRARLGEARDRPAIRHIVTKLAERHPGTSSAHANCTPQHGLSGGRCDASFETAYPAAARPAAGPSGAAASAPPDGCVAVPKRCQDSQLRAGRRVDRQQQRGGLIPRPLGARRADLFQ